MDKTVEQDALEFVLDVEKKVAQMDSGEYLEWFDGEGREAYLEEARIAGVEPKE